jgi:hypothetical protein
MSSILTTVQYFTDIIDLDPEPHLNPDSRWEL